MKLRILDKLVLFVAAPMIGIGVSIFSYCLSTARETRKEMEKEEMRESIKQAVWQAFRES